MRMRGVLGLALVILAALCAGCAGGQQTAAAPVRPDPAEAPVSEVEVLRLAGDSPDLRLVVRGTLPDACLRAGTAAVERRGKLFEVHLPVTRAQTGCPPVPLAYEQIVRLPSDGVAAGSYTLLVNGALFAFDVPAGVVAGISAAVEQDKPAEIVAAVEVTPAPEETELAVETPQAEETAAPEETAAVEDSAPKLVLGGTDPDGCHKAALFGAPSVEAGALFGPAETFTMTWRLRNEGTCAWGEDYQLVLVDGENLLAVENVTLPGAAPGAVVEIAAPMQAPIPAGKHGGTYAIAAPNGYVFGTGTNGLYPLETRIVTRAMQPETLALDLMCGAMRGYGEEQQVFNLINHEREVAGLDPVEWVEEIASVAANYSYELACYNRDFVDIHRGRDGFLYPVRLQNGGVLFETSNEMVYAGNGGPAGAVKWWMQSPIHNPIMLSDRYTRVGIGYVVLPKLPYQQRITVNFIRP